MPPPPSGLPFNAQLNAKYRPTKTQDKDLAKVKFIERFYRSFFKYYSSRFLKMQQSE